MTDKNIKIISATKDHVSIIHNFSKEMAEWEEVPFVLTEEQLFDLMFDSDRGLEGLVAYFEEKPIGFAVFFHNFPTFSGKKGLFIEDVWVTPDKRGMGFGKALLAELAKLTIERDCCRLEWWTMEWNTRAREFYKSLGAKTKDKCIIHHLKDDSLENLAKESIN